VLNIVGKRYWYFLISALIILPGLVSLFIPPGLKLAVDFTGGTLWEMKFARPATTQEVRLVLEKHGLNDAIVQTTGDGSILVRSREIKDGSDEKRAIVSDLTQQFGAYTEESFQSVGPAVGTEVAQRAIVAVAMASLGIMAYLWFAFRKVPSAWRYGVCAVVALLHDALVVVGVFSILGKLFLMEVDALFVTAVLTIIGFSVHDTIVVFDRIRENIGRYPGERFELVVNHSLLQTLGRSLATSLTVLLTLLALVLLGGTTTRTFSLVLLIGIASGTYSSIFNASMLLVVWENGELGRLFRRLVPAKATA